MLDGSWGYDKIRPTTSQKITNKRNDFTIKFAERIQNVQIECTDALRIIRSRDYSDAFFYCNPPYYNSDCGHYDGYTVEDFEMLLKVLSKLEGKFLLSSYPSELLARYTTDNGWHTHSIEQSVSVAYATVKPAKKKLEVLTANYDLTNPTNMLTLF
ncbi:MAG: DNA adenine methylase [Mangrovibacterium sp.]